MTVTTAMVTGPGDTIRVGKLLRGRSHDFDQFPGIPWPLSPSESFFALAGVSAWE